MPLYAYRCECGAEREAVREVAARDERTSCAVCGLPMARVPALIGVIAHNTKGGNLMHSTTTGSTWKGNRKPKTISRGNGLGGHPGRTPPRIYADPKPPEVKRG